MRLYMHLKSDLRYVRLDKGVIEDEDHHCLDQSRPRKISFTQSANRNWMAQTIEIMTIGENPPRWFCRLDFKKIDELAKA